VLGIGTNIKISTNIIKKKRIKTNDALYGFLSKNALTALV
jgi:hypothetical protein